MDKAAAKYTVDWIVDEYGPRQMAGSLKTHL